MQCCFVVKKTHQRCKRRSSGVGDPKQEYSYYLCAQHNASVQDWVNENCEYVQLDQCIAVILRTLQNADKLSHLATFDVVKDILTGTTTWKLLGVSGAKRKREEETPPAPPPKKKKNETTTRLANENNLPSNKNNSCALDSLFVALFLASHPFDLLWKSRAALVLTNKIPKNNTNRFEHCTLKNRQKIVANMMEAIDGLYDDKDIRDGHTCYTLRNIFSHCHFTQKDIRAGKHMNFSHEIVLVGKQGAMVTLGSVFQYYLALVNMFLVEKKSSSDVSWFVFPKQNSTLGYLSDFGANRIFDLLAENKPRRLNFAECVQPNDVMYMQGLTTLFINTEIVQETSMGFDGKRVHMAMPNAISNALKLKAVICRLGQTGSGHYVAFVYIVSKQHPTGTWIFYNDLRAGSGLVQPSLKSLEDLAEKKVSSSLPENFNVYSFGTFWIYANK